MTRIPITDRRDALLAAAVRVVAREGIALATTRAIAAEAGMPVASFHYVFESRDAMLHELAHAVIAEQQSEVTLGLGDCRDLEAFVRAALHAWLDRLIAHPETEVVLQELQSWSRWARDEQRLAATIAHANERSVQSFVDAARIRYDTEWSVAEGDVVRFVLVLTEGVASRWLEDRDDDTARRMLDHGALAVTRLAVQDAEVSA